MLSVFKRHFNQRFPKSVTSTKATLTLPTGKKLLKDDNYYTITVTSGSKAKADYPVVLKDKNGNEVTGTTDEKGIIILPGREHKAYIFGYNDGSFRPNYAVTRAEFVTMAVRYYALFNEVKKSDYTVNYTDLTKSYCAYYSIMEAANTHLGVANTDAENWVK